MSIGLRRLNYAVEVFLYTAVTLFLSLVFIVPAGLESTKFVSILLLFFKGFIGLWIILCVAKIVENLYRVIVPTTPQERLSNYLEKNGFVETEYEATAKEGINTEGSKDFEITLVATFKHKLFASSLKMIKIPLSKFRVYRYASFGIVEDYTHGKFDEITVYRKQ